MNAPASLSFGHTVVDGVGLGVGVGSGLTVGDAFDVGVGADVADGDGDDLVIRPVAYREASVARR
jgi:hypothetical protein